MRQLFRLFLPTLIPSWRFFEDIGPSARIEYRLNSASQWADALPRPATVSALGLFPRLFWNPDWNEYLFLTTCAERIILDPTDHSVAEINTCLIRRLHLADTTLQFRLVFISDEGNGLHQSVEYESTPVDVA